MGKKNKDKRKWIKFAYNHSKNTMFSEKINDKSSQFCYYPGFVDKYKVYCTSNYMKDKEYYFMLDLFEKEKNELKDIYRKFIKEIITLDNTKFNTKKLPTNYIQNYNNKIENIINKDIESYINCFYFKFNSFCRKYYFIDDVQKEIEEKNFMLIGRIKKIMTKKKLDGLNYHTKCQFVQYTPKEKYILYGEKKKSRANVKNEIRYYDFKIN